MKLAKTQAGQRVMKDRSVALSPRQRAAFILCDATHTVDQVLAAAGPVGVTPEDIRHLVELGLLEEVPDPEAQAAQQAAKVLHDRSPQERYLDAYPIATRLTSSLGLRGFRLNLAVEAALDYQQLRDLAPKIRQAVGDAAYEPLETALNG